MNEKYDKRQREARDPANNSAQQQFEAKIAEVMAHAGGADENRIREFHFPLPLVGSLDFGKTPNSMRPFFAKLTKLSFPMGEITDIKGLNHFPGLKELNISGQLLTDIEFPKQNNLTHLNIAFNGINEVNWSVLRKLVEVNIAHNRFSKIPNLPSNLEHLHAENNRLELLNLSSLSKLRHVNVSNNPTAMVIVPPPPSIDYELVQNDETSFAAHTDLYTNPLTKNPTAKTVEQIVKIKDYEEALKLYYDYKAKYEQKIAEDKTKIWKDNSHAAAKELLRKYVPVCINCDQPGGMIFQFSNETARYKAMCGATYPCNFNLELYRVTKEYKALDAHLTEEKEDFEKLRQEYIMATMETMYGFIDKPRGLKKCEQIMDECNGSKKIIENVQKRIDGLFDKQRKERIDNLTKEIGEWICQNKVLITPTSAQGVVEDLMNKRRQTEDISRLNDFEDEAEEDDGKTERLRMVVENEVCQLFPLAEKLRRQKYDRMEITKVEQPSFQNGKEIPVQHADAHSKVVGNVFNTLWQEKIAFEKTFWPLPEHVESPAVIQFSI